MIDPLYIVIILILIVIIIIIIYLIDPTPHTGSTSSILDAINNKTFTIYKQDIDTIHYGNITGIYNKKFKTITFNRDESKITAKLIPESSGIDRIITFDDIKPIILNDVYAKLNVNNIENATISILTAGTNESKKYNIQININGKQAMFFAFE